MTWTAPRSEPDREGHALDYPDRDAERPGRARELAETVPWLAIHRSMTGISGQVATGIRQQVETP